MSKTILGQCVSDHLYAFQSGCQEPFLRRWFCTPGPQSTESVPSCKRAIPAVNASERTPGGGRGEREGVKMPILALVPYHMVGEGGVGEGGFLWTVFIPKPDIYRPSQEGTQFSTLASSYFLSLCQFFLRLFIHNWTPHLLYSSSFVFTILLISCIVFSSPLVLVFFFFFFIIIVHCKQFSAYVFPKKL